MLGIVLIVNEIHCLLSIVYCMIFEIHLLIFMAFTMPDCGVEKIKFTLPEVRFDLALTLHTHGVASA